MIIDSDNDTSCTVLYNKIIRPTIQEGEWVELETRLSGITKEDYHNGIPYEEAIVEVVGHNVLSDFHALDLSIYSSAHCIFDTHSKQ